MYDLLFDLINRKISISEEKQEQEDMIIKIEELKNFIFLEEESITERKTERKQILVIQKRVIKNAIKQYDKITYIINAFVNKIILFWNLEENIFDKSKYSEPKLSFEESMSGRTNMRRQKKSGEENQEGKGLKILAPDQSLSRLLITY